MRDQLAQLLSDTMEKRFFLRACATAFVFLFLFILRLPSESSGARFAVRQVTNFGDPRIGSAATPLGVVGDHLVFVAEENRIGGLYRTDGTTVQLIDEAFVVSIAGSIQLDDELFFSAGSSNQGVELFATDGESIRQVADIVPGGFGSQPANFREVNGKLLFDAYGMNSTDGSAYRRLFHFDGNTVDELPVIKDPRTNFARIGNRLMFYGGDDKGNGGLYTTDGQSLTKIDARPFTGDIKVLDDQAYMIGGIGTEFGLYRSDGTSIERIFPIEYDAIGDIAGLFEFDGRMNLALFDRPKDEMVFYREDGSSVTEILRQSVTNVDAWLGYHRIGFDRSFPTNPVLNDGDRAYFAFRNDEEYGLYAYDGHSFELVLDSNSSFQPRLTELNNGRLFVHDGSRISGSSLFEIVDGQEIRLGPDLRDLTIFEGEVLGFADEPRLNKRLWQTVNGRLVPFGPIFGDEPRARNVQFIEFNGQLFFRGADGSNAQLYAIVPVPEPASMILWLGATIGPLAFKRWARRNEPVPQPELRHDFDDRHDRSSAARINSFVPATATFG